MIRAALALALAASPAMADSLRICTEVDYPPYMARNAQGELHGFEHDLGMALCAAMEAECSWEVVTFDAILPAVAAGDCEMGIASIAATPERREIVDFSIPYGGAGTTAGVFIATNPNTRIADARIGVQAGTIHAGHLAARGQEAITFPSNEAALAALARHEIDLLFAAPGVLQAAQERQYPGLRITGSEEIPGWGTAVAVARGATVLRKRIDAALHAMFTEGVVDDIESRWFVPGTST